MANPEHLTILEQGAPRKGNVRVRPDLIKANLSGGRGRTVRRALKYSIRLEDILTLPVMIGRLPREVTPLLLH